MYYDHNLRVFEIVKLKEAAQMFLLISNAYEVLSKPRQRAAYDEEHDIESNVSHMSTSQRNKSCPNAHQS